MAGNEQYTAEVTLTVHGVQATCVQVQDAGTDNASISLRIGLSLIRLLDRASARTLADAWRNCTPASRSLPPSSELADAPTNSSRAAVTVTIAGRPPTSSYFQRLRDRTSSVTLRIGGLVFDIRDRAAYASALGAVVEAERLADTELGP